MTRDILDIGRFEAPLLVFGGPYSNRQATEALLGIAAARDIPPHRMICTGDIVAYCAEPEATTRLLRESGMPVVLGNCEESLANRDEDCGCGFEAGTTCDVLTDSWYPYASANLSEESRAWMKTLPASIKFTLQDRQFLVVHGSVSRINRFVFESTPMEEKRAEFERTEADCLIAGHCGIPFGQAVDDKFWLNAGAIGMPANDGTQDGWFLLLEPEDHGVYVSWHRLEYDAPSAYAAMQSAGQHNAYAEALLSGHWPSMDVLPERERQQQGKAISLPVMRL